MPLPRLYFYPHSQGSPNSNSQALGRWRTPGRSGNSESHQCVCNAKEELTGWGTASLLLGAARSLHRKGFLGIPAVLLGQSRRPGHRLDLPYDPLDLQGRLAPQDLLGLEGDGLLVLKHRSRALALSILAGGQQLSGPGAPPPRRDYLHGEAGACHGARGGASLLACSGATSSWRGRLSVCCPGSLSLKHTTQKVSP